MHSQRHVRATARRPPRLDGDQPGQPRAKPGRDFPGVLQGNRTDESHDPVMAMYLFALRLGRWGIAGFGAVAFLFALVQAAGFYKIAGRTEAERQAFGRSMSILATQFTVIIAPPIRPDTVGGYVQWRAFGFLAILFAIWGLASASGAARGDEERGIVQAMLVGGLSRPRMIAARVAAFATGCMVAAVAASAGLLLAVAGAGEMISPVAALQAAVAVAALGVSCYALTLLFAQFTSARNSTAFGGVILLALFLINSLSRTFDALVRWRWLSPFHYYEQSSPLAPAGTLDAAATLVLLGIAVAAAVLGAFAFRYRDVGSPLISLPAPTRRASYQMSRSPVWRVPVLRDLYERRASLLVWAAGLSALGAIFVVLTKSIVKPLLAIPELAPYFAIFVNGNIYASFLGYIWFGFAQLLMAGFAITQVARWSAEDSDGRLEIVLSNPVSRARVEDPPRDRRHPRGFCVYELPHRAAGTNLQAACVGAGFVGVQALRPTALCRNGPNWFGDHAGDRARRTDGFRFGDGAPRHWRLTYP